MTGARDSLSSVAQWRDHCILLWVLYFGPHRVCGKRGGGASGKTIVFGLLKRGNEVYTQIVPNASKATLQAVIRYRDRPESILHTDGWRGYDGLVYLGFDKQFRVSHSYNEFARGPHHVNGIESFWSFAKRRPLKFNGTPNIPSSERNRIPLQPSPEGPLQNPAVLLQKSPALRLLLPKTLTNYASLFEQARYTTFRLS